MKELTIEEKAKAYDEAIERAKYYQKENGSAVISAIFPELKESEDERIRKGLLYVIEHHPTLPKEEAEEYIAWLKKQNKQKTVDEIAKEVCKNKESAMAFLKSAGIINEKGELAEQYRQEGQKPAEEYNITGIRSKNAQGKLGEMIKKLKPVNEVLEQGFAWSEEDENYKDALIGLINEIKSQPLKRLEDWDSYLNWLKSLKDKYTWKPSDEQMEGIECTIKTLKYQLNCGDNRLDSLYADLKKLREE